MGSFSIVCVMMEIGMDCHGSTHRGCLAQLRGQREFPERGESLTKINFK